MTTPRSSSRSRRRTPRRNVALRSSIGPVEDLESYVKAEWWRDIFNANYLRTDGDVVEDPEITQTEIDAFLGMIGIARDAAILDVCCGQGRHVLELASRGFTDLHGVDRSHYLISRAKRLATERGLTVGVRAFQVDPPVLRL